MTVFPSPISDESSIKSPIKLMAEYWPIKPDNSRLKMADLQSLLLFVKYEKLSERSERVVLPRNHLFDEYDDKKFRERF